MDTVVNTEQKMKIYNAIVDMPHFLGAVRNNTATNFTRVCRRAINAMPAEDDDAWLDWFGGMVAGRPPDEDWCEHPWVARIIEDARMHGLSLLQIAKIKDGSVCHKRGHES